MRLKIQPLLRSVHFDSSRLTAFSVFLCILLGSALTGSAGELLRNHDFSQGLTNWRKAPELAGWSPLDNSILDLNPADDFRGDLIWQPLNIAGPGGETFTFQVDMSRVSAEIGSAVGFSIEFTDDQGEARRVPLIDVSNGQLPPAGQGWLTLQREWHCPPEALRLTKLVIARTGPGHLQLQNPSLSHPLLDGGPLPAISTTSHSSGPYNTDITISGQYFGAVPGKVYFDTVGNDWFNDEPLSITGWTDTTITARVGEWNSHGGEFIVITDQGVENSESVNFELTSPHFTLKALTPLLSAVHGEVLSFAFELTTSANYPSDSQPIEFIFDGMTCMESSACTLSQTTVAPGPAQTVPIIVTIDTGQLAPGHVEDHLQTISSTYARFAAFEFDTAPRIQSPRASGVAEFERDGSVESGMGLPKHRINLATLDPILETCLFRMKTHGPPIRLDLWYLGNDERNGLFGRGWRMSYESSIEYDAHSATLFTPSGKALRFSTWQSLSAASEANPVVLTPPAGNYDSLRCYGTYFEYAEKSTKLRYRYEQTAAGAEMAYLTRISDRNDQTVTVQTDLATGRINAISDEAGRSFSFVYNGAGHAVSVQAPDGRGYTFSYLSERISAIQDPAGYSGTYSYDGDGYLTLVSTAGRQALFTYADRPGLTGDKYVSRVTGDDGRQTSYAFKSGEAGVIRVTDGRGNVREHHYQGDKPTLTIDPTGELRRIGYENERPIILSDGAGTTRIEYDSRGNVTRVVDALGQATVLAYDGDDNMVSRTDAAGKTWTYLYDANHNLTGVTDPLAKTMTITRDARGRVSTVTDQRGKTSRVAYDSWGNPTTYTDPLNQVSHFIYSASGMRLARIVDANGDYKEIAYDGLDRVTSVEYRAALTGTLLGRRAQQWSPFGATAFIDERGSVFSANRNALGQLTGLTDPQGAVTTYEHDTSGNRIGTSDPLNRVTSFEYDGANRLITTTDPLGHVVRRTYDAGGRLSGLRDANDNLTTWDYDARGDLIAERDALGENVRTERDGLGRPARRFNARGQEIQYSYDPLGNLTRKLYYGQGIQYDYVFDAAGNLTEMTGPDGTTAYQYTDRGEVSRIDYANGAVIRFTYDSVGNLSALTYPDGQVINYQYDRFNRIPFPALLRNPGGELMGFDEPSQKPVSVSWGGNSLTVDYDGAALPVTISRSNGVDTAIGYDAAGRHIRIGHTDGTTVLDDMIMQYNAAGELTSQSYTGAALFPSIAGGAATINALNQISTWDGNAYHYDKDGNLTAAGERFTAAYDAENQLVSLTRSGSTVTYGYNGLSQRVSRSAGTVRHYLHDRAGRLLCITDPTGGVVSNIVYAGNMVVASGSAAGGYRYPLFDGSGNIVSITDAAGSVLTAYRYLPFGLVQRTGATAETPFTFAGLYGVLDEGDGIYATRRRFYDSRLGTFLQRDPIGIAGGINLYTYSDNNPLIKSDPSGENPYLIAFGLWAGYRIYNAYGTGKHAVNAVHKAGETGEKFRETTESFGRAKRSAKNLSRLSDQPVEGLDNKINRQDNLRKARRDTYNGGVEVKDGAIETAAAAGQAAYHGARAIQGLLGATAPEPGTIAGKVAEGLTDASFNDLDRAVINWDTVPDPFE